MLPTEQGRLAEDYACSYLQKAGLTLITRNFRCRYGEIDLIMQQKKEIVFVEVRYRKSLDFGSAIESINTAKKKRLRQTAHVYLQQCSTIPAYDWRFDWFGLSPAEQAHEFQVEWIENAWEIDN